MEIIKQVLKKYWPLFVLSLVTYIIAWPTLMPGYFSHHDDLQVMRIFEMRRCFNDLQLPCRWVPDMGYGNGFPLYNYYSALPYYLGAVLSYAFGFIGAAKLLFLIPLVLGIISMYYLANELFGENLAVVSAALYGLAPYRALDSYVRGDIAESFALAIAPLLFLFSLKLIRLPNKNNFLIFTLTLAAFLITHNIMTLFFLPLLISWIIFNLIQCKFRNFKQVFIAVVLGFGLAAFFILPAFLEKDLVQTETLTRGYLDFRANFVTFYQLFLTNFWGYGASVPGDQDTISFQVGWPLWWLVTVSTIYLIFQSIKNKRKNITYYLLVITFAFATLMTHNKSAFIWEKIGILRYAQFPWRFLTIIIFSGSLLGVVWLQALKGRVQFAVISLIIFLTIFLNASFFKPEVFYPALTDEGKLSGYYFEQQQKAAILDYLPNGIPEPTEQAPNSALIKMGQGLITNFDNHSNYWQFQANVSSNVLVEVPVFDFPNWTVFVDGNQVIHSNANHIKRIMVNLSPGNHQVKGEFKNTPIRTFSNYITLFSFIILLTMYGIYGKLRKIFS